MNPPSSTGSTATTHLVEPSIPRQKAQSAGISGGSAVLIRRGFARSERVMPKRSPSWIDSSIE
jgi:hypothetical protein